MDLYTTNRVSELETSPEGGDLDRVELAVGETNTYKIAEYHQQSEKQPLPSLDSEDAVLPTLASIAIETALIPKAIDVVAAVVETVFDLSEENIPFAEMLQAMNKAA